MDRKRSQLLREFRGAEAPLAVPAAQTALAGYEVGFYGLVVCNAFWIGTGKHARDFFWKLNCALLYDLSPFYEVEGSPWGYQRDLVRELLVYESALGLYDVLLPHALARHVHDKRHAALEFRVYVQDREHREPLALRYVVYHGPLVYLFDCQHTNTSHHVPLVAVRMFGCAALSIQTPQPIMSVIIAILTGTP